MPTRRTPTRRTFVKQLAAASAACGLTPSLAAPAIAADSKTGHALPILGSGAHRYECNHFWPQLPDKYTWQTTHNVAVDSAGLVYVIHEGRLEQPDHPAIFVFDETGKFVRAFGHEFQGGGHGLETRREGSDEFLYVTAYQQQRSFAKLTLTGEIVWRKYAPMETGFYDAGEDVVPRKKEDNPWGKKHFMPTNYAFHPTDGGFYLADGYGAFRIHKYDASGKWQSSFGKPSDSSHANGTFDTPHGVWMDNRRWSRTSSTQDELAVPPHIVASPSVLVADRANNRLQWFSLEGEHRHTLDGFLLPANCDTHGEVLLVPELLGRVTLLDNTNEVIARLGDDSERIIADKPDGKVKKQWVIRFDEKQWTDGKFVHPHDACFDAHGNIYVAEWVNSGRISKLTKVS